MQKKKAEAAAAAAAAAAEKGASEAAGGGSAPTPTDVKEPAIVTPAPIVEGRESCATDWHGRKR
eukprot:751348-Hanusia_phi.AAC.1